MASARDANCTPKSAEVVALASRLHKQGVSYRAIGAELAKAGHVNERGRPFHLVALANITCR
jgi:hypothetical protein